MSETLVDIKLPELFSAENAFEVSEYEKFLEHARFVDIPARKQEDWRYSKVGSLLKKSYKRIEPVSYELPEAVMRMIGDSYSVVLVNGQFNHKLSVIPDGSWLEIKAHTSVPENGIEPSIKNIFALYNTATFTTEVIFRIPEDSHIDKPVFIIHARQGNSGYCASRFVIDAAKGSSVSIVELYLESSDEGLYNTHVITRLRESAEVQHHCAITSMAEEHVVRNHFVEQHKNSRYTTGHFIFGGRMIRNTLHIDIEEEGCETNLFGSYMLNGREQSDIRVVMNHKAGQSNSSQNFKGVLTDKSEGIFNGIIYVQPDAQRTNAYQSNKNIVLTDDATAYSRPQLEIYADDVKCSHGSTTGQLDQDALYYAMTRGIPRRDAELMLVSAFIREAINGIEQICLQEYLDHLLQKKFSQMQK
jgi:Fe-S cluster assembly protein SufD